MTLSALQRSHVCQFTPRSVSQPLISLAAVHGGIVVRGFELRATVFITEALPNLCGTYLVRGLSLPAIKVLLKRRGPLF